MAKNPRNLLFSPFPLLCILFLLSFFFSQSSADAPPASPVPPSKVCKSTPFPSFCNTVLPASNSSANVYDYGRFSVRKSLSAARKFLSLIEKYLRKSKQLTITAVRALEDCKFLAESNIDNLMSSFQIVDQTSRTLSVLEADDVQTLLSAILTNTQTCIDGLQATASAWSVRNGILSPLSNDTRLYSVSLALFTKGWVPKKKNRPSFSNPAGRKQLKMRNGSLNLKMSARNQAIYRTVNNRRLLQADIGDDQVLVSDVVIVSQDGSGNFTAINDAVAAAPNNTDGTSGYFLIYITAGVYEEYVSIAVVGTGFVAVNITIRNTAGAIKHQAVAVRNGADLSIFYSCSFEAYQDTLYVHSLRQFYVECDIYGTVDFIFGNAAVVFQSCNLYPRLPMSNQFNAITAQGRTDPNQNTGISIQNCTIRAADDLANSNITIRTYLGRPWKEYSRTVYMQSFMDSLISPEGWTIWSGDFALNTSYYAEFNNTGPGSNTSQRVTWPGFHIINATDAANFTVPAFLLGDAWPKRGPLIILVLFHHITLKSTLDQTYSPAVLVSLSPSNF
ncbi:UNVERIFIED_CONTAM: putative pectinesterase/pectinesterase inhibitor 7 [Sesamum calycinum]|uniref:Pectinesterase n=1 Tax=Sesamum calycinum TaxID=2727403 RepID=A0AAW2SDA3_9LAMI